MENVFAHCPDQRNVAGLEMIITKTPHRISFFGGGTDYPDYYLQHGGKVLGVAIDKYCYLSVRKLPPFFEHKHRIVYSRIENVNQLSEIDHPSVRETLVHLGIDYGISIHHDGDIPARSGMGSSSSFTAGLLKSLYALEGRMIGKHELATEAIYVEQKLIKENVGSQDQTFAAYGGLNLIEFLKNGEIVVNPVIMRPEKLAEFEKHFLLFFSGISRIASDVAGEQISKIPQNLTQLGSMKDLVDQAFSILADPESDLDAFGEMLNDTWKLKKSLSAKVTTTEIDEMYDAARQAGAIGGKLLGAGGGGFILFYAHPEDHDRIRNRLSQFLNIPFSFDFDGSSIIVYRQ